MTVSCTDMQWVYEVSCVNPLGEQRVVVVELSDAERQDCLYNLAVHPDGSDGPGGDNGPLAKRYALNRAEREAPPGYSPVAEGIRRVDRLRLVN